MGIGAIAEANQGFKQILRLLCTWRPSHALGRRERCVKHAHADGAGGLPVQPHLVPGVAAEHLKPQRLRPQG
eukprot:CAMPEP_0175733172 /NCGR_PEP_ID=MMETSP0097-20121207/51738_1 /TAXON_ID=311494 /ORGANISM="Alexandrium monilatum, Strain CCMP3105" /LENGTH=71 /DNA_ID=CAMNT_0017041169 /DNA_START=107 /DNA_END=319 /DNA_ORIENTATION=+